MGNSHLSFTHRAALVTQGLATPSEVKDLISDALASNMMAYLPKELGAYAQELLRRHEITLPES